MMLSQSRYRRTVNELQLVASVFWPVELSEKAFEQSVIPVLLNTHESFVSILNVPVSSIDGLFEIINVSTFPPRLFLKHLLVLTDFGGEMLQRVNSFFSVLFPSRTMEYSWDDEKQVHQFRQLPVSGSLDSTRLRLKGSNLLKKVPADSLLQDVMAILIYGSVCTDSKTAEVLRKCEVSKYIGHPNKLSEYMKQRYIWVSPITTGSQSNTLGQLAEKTVKDYLEANLNIDGAEIRSNGHLPGVTHRDEQSSVTRLTTFDILISKDGKYVAVEVSFQVTTNSVIELKGREALSIFTQADQFGHKIAYVIDGAGNFQRRTAVSSLCLYSHCTVAFSEPEFEILIQFIREHLSS